ncbi:uncharacterized protein LOC110684758 [Chenopodium quinoa]|uniref:uncharacterized protein LOC110684758 n=1 Tax=Chenopodium quinoa TaxID=63459 RepID=UPI000B796D3A|nr:uncharacterized protein LOC110684758 [Chenopodium quinoa]
MVGKPLYDANKNLLHDGKYGISPFVFKKRSVKSSKNRVAGTMETNTIESVTKEVTRKMLLEHVIPAIKSKWHPSLCKNVFIQWGNARPHQIPTDEEFQEACTSDGFNIQMVFQLTLSLDLNVLDLGLFTSIQSIQYKSFPKNLDELNEKVNEAYALFDPKMNRNTWITLQKCMTEIMCKNGGNNYPLPHMDKNRPVNQPEDQDTQIQVDAD